MDVKNCIGKLTLEEKAILLQGASTWTTAEIPRLGIPSIFLADGPHGLRKQTGSADHLGLNASLPATCFPAAAAMANSWDLELAQKLGCALGAEAASQNVQVLLGPGLNIKRSPLCGRNFEYFSEDPYLSGKMAAAYIRGIQSQGVAACPKHFAANSQELRRMSMDSVVDERTLREIYLTGFEIAVKEGGAKTIMSSYNRVNGTYANENTHLLTEILRDEWGFEGFVVTDWGADNDHLEGIRAGSNLVMPNPGLDEAIALVEAVRDGKLSEKVLDARLEELLKVVSALEKQETKRGDEEAHHRLAEECAAGSIVLLENDGILPLKKNQSVALIGDFALAPRYQGAGSSLVNPTKLENLQQCLAQRNANLVGWEQGFARTGNKEEVDLIPRAVKLACRADCVLLCVGLDEMAEAEGLDRTHLELPENQNRLIKAVCEANPNTVLVLSGGAPFLLSQAPYRAVVHGYLGGQAGAGAMADVLLGTVNPSGKLSETWPVKLEDTPAHNYYPSPEGNSQYREALFVGYRWYDSAGIPVRYPFGHGLSYTRFAYSDLCADEDKVSFTLTNTGSLPGGEVAQLYVSCKNGKVFRPARELKGFAKVFLEPGQSRRVSIPLDDKAFRYFNVKTGRWERETGTYTLSVGASVAQILLEADVFIQGSDAPLPYGQLPCYEQCRIQNVPDEAFAALLGRPVPDGKWTDTFQVNDSLCQLGRCRGIPARLTYKILHSQYEKALRSGKPDLNILFIYNMPCRAIGKYAGGYVSGQMVEDLVLMWGGHFFLGFGRLIRDFFRNRRKNRAFTKKLKEVR